MKKLIIAIFVTILLITAASKSIADANCDTSDPGDVTITFE